MALAKITSICIVIYIATSQKLLRRSIDTSSLRVEEELSPNTVFMSQKNETNVRGNQCGCLRGGPGMPPKHHEETYHSCYITIPIINIFYSPQSQKTYYIVSMTF